VKWWGRENLIQIHEFKETVAIPSSVSLKRDFLSLICVYLKQIFEIFKTREKNFF